MFNATRYNNITALLLDLHCFTSMTIFHSAHTTLLIAYNKKTHGNKTQHAMFYVHSKKCLSLAFSLNITV